MGSALIVLVTAVAATSPIAGAGPPEGTAALDWSDPVLAMRWKYGRVDGVTVPEELSRERVAGVYRRSDHLGSEWTLTLSADGGFEHAWRRCNGSNSSTAGRWSQAGPTLSLTYDRTPDPGTAPPATLDVLRYGSDLVLVPSDESDAFVSVGPGPSTCYQQAESATASTAPSPFVCHLSSKGSVYPTGAQPEFSVRITNVSGTDMIVDGRPHDSSFWHYSQCVFHVDGGPIHRPRTFRCQPVCRTADLPEAEVFCVPPCDSFGPCSDAGPQAWSTIFRFPGTYRIQCFYFTENDDGEVWVGNDWREWRTADTPNDLFDQVAAVPEMAASSNVVVIQILTQQEYRQWCEGDKLSPK